MAIFDPGLQQHAGAYASLLKKSQEAQQAENLERRQKGEQFKVIDPARIPEKPYRPDIPKILLIGLCSGGLQRCGGGLLPGADGPLLPGRGRPAGDPGLQGSGQHSPDRDQGELKHVQRIFRFKEKPFEITVDPRFLYLSETHKEALAHLVYAGAGEKGVCGRSPGRWGPGRPPWSRPCSAGWTGNTRTAFLFNPKLENNNEFLYSICEDLEIRGEKGNKVDYLNRLNDFLMDCFTRRENVVVIIDEAHALSPELLEEVRLLTNLETPSQQASPGYAPGAAGAG